MSAIQHPVRPSRPVVPTTLAPSAGFLWLATLLLLILHLTLAWSLDAAGWAEGLNVTAWAALAGVVVGAQLAQVGWPRWFVRVYGLITGMALALYLGATLMPDALTDVERAVAVLKRLSEWATAAISGETTGDNVVFVVDVAFLLWWSGLLTTRALLREGRVWVAILPPGLLLTVNAYYAAANLRPFLLVYLGAALVLLVVTHLYTQMARWEQEHVRYPLDIAVDFLRNGVLMALAVLMVAWTLPPVATAREVADWLAPLERSWRRVQEEWGRVFNTLNYQAGGVIPTFSRSFDLRGAPNLTETPYFRIQAPKGRYWRAAVYDRYRGNGWDSTVGDWRTLGEEDGVAPPAIRAVDLVTQTITVLLPGTVSLVAAPMPVRFSIPVDADVVAYPDEVGGGGEVLFAYARRALDANATYTVVSLSPNPTANELRRAGTDYPAWIRERYLQIPDTVPARVRELAARLTSGLDNPYDKARAIEAYLRDIPYNEQIPKPPQDQDAVDWFLFDLRQGYCDYYASAMVIMARSVGIPARLASGYARGEYNRETGTWLVRESDAHSWPELYFPGYGWVPFEPTPSEPPLIRPENTPDMNEENRFLEDLQDPLPEEDRNIPEDVEALGQPIFALGPWAFPVPPGLAPLVRYARDLPWPWVGGPVVGMALAWSLRHVWRRRRERLLARPDLPVVLYARLLRWARRLGVPVRPSQTPTEQAALLGTHLPEHRPVVVAIVRTYEQSVYAPPAYRQAARAHSERLWGLWQRLQRALWRYWLIRWLRRFGERATRRSSPTHV